MLSALYQHFEQLGFTHPLHPAATHIPVGCIIAAFLFLFASRWSRNSAYFQSARHCMVLALLFWPITALLGYMDWQHTFAGAWIAPIKIKLALAGLLFFLLLVMNVKNRQLSRPTVGKLLGYTLCLGLVVGLGYFGGQLVYAPPTLAAEETAPTAAVQNGAELFSKNCAFCHHNNRASKKVGPGLKGIFNQPAMPTSGWAMSEKNLRRQIQTPFAMMPSFSTLSRQETADLIAYLKSI